MKIKIAWVPRALCALILLLAAACASQPFHPDAAAPVQPGAFPTNNQPAPPLSEPSPIPQAAVTPVNPHGVAVRVTGACSDGIQTVLRLQTGLEYLYWGLNPEAGGSWDDMMIETSIVFWENDSQFSSTSSGWRGEPVIDVVNHMVRVDQSFIFPEIPSPGAQLSLTGEITLSNLPANYQPPASVPGVTLPAPGLITISIPNRLPVVVAACN